MVEPIESQNMVARTPLVEKTVAAHREQALQQQAQSAQIQRDRVHDGETVPKTADEARVETRKERDRKKRRSCPTTDHGSAGDARVERVSRPTDEPDHEIDISV